MTKATVPTSIIAVFMGLRNLSEDTAKPMRKQLFAALKTKFGIPAAHALKVELDDTSSAVYATLLRKKGSEAYELHADGKWVGWTGRPAPVATPVATPAAAPTAVTAGTAYPAHAPGQSPRRFFEIDADGINDVLDSASFIMGADVLHGVVLDQQISYNGDTQAYRRTLTTAGGTLYAEFSASEL